MIPSEDAYTDEVKSRPDFDIKNMEYIWPRVQIANGKDIACWDIINDKETVEKLTLACMRKHFAQSQGTPFTSDFWIDELTKEDAQNKILDGEYDSSPYDKSIQLYLNALQRPLDHPDELKFECSFVDFCSFIRGADERTSASPSGRHYGHYKVLLRRCPRILQDVYRLMKLAFEHGIFMDRYRRTVTTLIAKDKGSPRIHRLRPIHIIEIELQALSKSQWAKKLIKRAEKLRMITDSQYGDRA